MHTHTYIPTADFILSCLSFSSLAFNHLTPYTSFPSPLLPFLLCAGEAQVPQPQASHLQGVNGGYIHERRDGIYIYIDDEERRKR
jgi:hypothetical protein